MRSGFKHQLLEIAIPKNLKDHRRKDNKHFLWPYVRHLKSLANWDVVGRDVAGSFVHGSLFTVQGLGQKSIKKRAYEQKCFLLKSSQMSSKIDFDLKK